MLLQNITYKIGKPREDCMIFTDVHSVPTVAN